MVPTSRQGRELAPLRSTCPTHRLMGLIGDRWSVLVLIAVHDNVEIRTADLLRAIDGISQKMLTQTLRRLERHDLVERRVEPTVPVSVSYRLTERGDGLYGALAALRTWAEANADDLSE